MKLSEIIVSGLVFSLVIVLVSGIYVGTLGNDAGISSLNYAANISSNMQDIENELESSSSGQVSLMNYIMIIPQAAITAIKMTFSSVATILGMVTNSLSMIGIPWQVSAIIISIVLAIGVFALVSALTGRDV